MKFRIDAAVEVLARTPPTLRSMLGGHADEWARADEGAESWSAFDVVGHLVHGEKTDWIPRARHILEHGSAKAFVPFDRFAQFEDSRGKSLAELLDEFESLRAQSLRAVRDLDLSGELERAGRHPDFGPVTMRELLATWVVHDLGHIAQIARVMAKQYSTEVGPWRGYLPVLADRRA